MRAQTSFPILLSLLLLTPVIAAPANNPFPVPKSRFYLRNLKTAYYTSERPVDPTWFASVRNLVATPQDLKPNVHPRVLTSKSEWHALITRHAHPKNFDKDRTWSKSFLKLTRGNGPESTFVDMLAELETSGNTSPFLGKHRNDFSSDDDYNKYRATLKPLADHINQSDEIKSHHLFLCAFWASVSQKQGANAFLPNDVMKKCIHASVAWAKVLISHRTYHCNPTCTKTTIDSERSYLWNSEIMWSVSHDWYLVGSSLALAYDVMHDTMSSEQRQVVRSAISLLVLKRWTWGIADESDANNPNAETDPHRIFSNWATYHSNLYLTNLAIEGESGYVSYVDHILRKHNVTGFNEKMDKKFNAVYKAYFEHSIYPDGSSFEDGYTFHTALREGALGLLVAHRRGANILNTPRFRNMIHHVAQQWEPRQCGHLIGHASGGGMGYPSYVGLLRYAYPDGKLPRMVWAQRFGKDFLNSEECRIWYVQTMTQLAIFGDEHLDEYENIADSPESLPEPWKSKFPLSYVAPRRGLIITRGSHAQMTSYMHLDARPDTMFLGHDNADRGVVTLSALKKIWLDDLLWEGNIVSDKHSLMHVDGLAQANKAPSATILKVVDNKEHCIASADLSYTYNVQWAQAWQGPNSGSGQVKERNPDGSYSEKTYSFKDAEPNSPWDLGWPMEDEAKDIGFYRGMTLCKIPDISFSGINEWRRHYRPNPLRHMVRSTVMVRSPKNDVGCTLLVDSVDAGPGSHTFESYLILHADVVVDSSASKCSGNTCKIVLKNTGNEQLDIHAISRGSNLAYRTESFDGNKKIILKTSGTTSEEFWVAFHPHIGDSRGFEMSRDSKGAMKIVYEQETRRFVVDSKDHTVIDADGDSSYDDFSPTSSAEGENVEPKAEEEIEVEAVPSPSSPTPKSSKADTEGEENLGDEPSPSTTTTPTPTPASKAADSESLDDQSTPPASSSEPMQPLALTARGWQKVSHEMLQAIRPEQYYEATDAKHQIVLHVTSDGDGKFGDRFQTCRGYTNAETRMKLYDCGAKEEGMRNYLTRACRLVEESSKRHRCLSERGAKKTDFKPVLEYGKEYYLVVDVLEDVLQEARLLIGHKYYWTR